MLIERFKNHRIAVVMGGPSSERAVSLKTGEAIAAALETSGYDVVCIDADHNLPQVLRSQNIGVVFNALHGVFGEDGRIQGLLDWLAIPYTGEGLRSSFLGFDKALAKACYRTSGVPVAQDVVVDVRHLEAIEADDFQLNFPVVVKPVSEGSSVGVEKVDTYAELLLALGAASQHYMLVEEWITGPEVSIVCLGDQVLGGVEIAPKGGFYDYEAKYGDAGTQYFVPPRLGEKALKACEAAGLAAHKALGCTTVTRSDLILGPQGPVVLETNTLPGMTASSLVPKVAAALGWSFEDLVERILDLASYDAPDGQGSRT